MSSVEAEYVAACTATYQAMWFRRLLGDLGHKQTEATSLLCDSASAIAMTKNPVMHGRTKHIEIKHHFIRDLVAQGEVKLEFCRTEVQMADMFTKALFQSKFEEMRRKLCITSFESMGSVEEMIQSLSREKAPENA